MEPPTLGTQTKGRLKTEVRKGGSTAGATDEFGIRALEKEIPLRDVHAAILHLMGLDDKRLTYLHAGRFRKLTDIGGDTLKEIIA